MTSYVRRGTSLPRDLVAAVRRLDEAQLRRLLILVRGLLVGSQGPTVELDEVEGMPAVTYRRQHVRCGKRCGSCPHGPYWYAFWKEGGRSRSQYIGSTLPAEVQRLLDGFDDLEISESNENLRSVTQLRSAAADVQG